MIHNGKIQLLHVRQNYRKQKEEEKKKESHTPLLFFLAII